MTSAAEVLDELLAAMTPEVAAALRTTIPVDLRDQLDAASCEISQTLALVGAHLGAEPIGLPAWVALPAWLRLSVTDTLVGFAAGTGSTCMHAPHLGRAEPLHAAVWKPDLVTCMSCSHLLALGGGPAAHTCDGCGRVCPPTHEDGVRLVALAVGPVLFVTGCCPDCAPAALRPARRRDHPAQPPRPHHERADMTTATTLSAKQVRREAETYLKSLGALGLPGYWNIRSTVHERRRLQIKLNVSGKVTTHLAMDRCDGVDAPPAADGWLRDNLWPYCRAYCARTRGWNTMPSAGTYSSTYILTSDLLDVLKLWVPMELHWQDTLADPT